VANFLRPAAFLQVELDVVELHPDVLKALDVLPLPKAAPLDCRLFFSGGNASVCSLVKRAQRILSAVFKRAKVDRGHPHRFRHYAASRTMPRVDARARI
jgi:integrase